VRRPRSPPPDVLPPRPVRPLPPYWRRSSQPGGLACPAPVPVTYYNQYRARRQNREDNFFSALNWLTGESQKRNVGIAAVEFFARGTEQPEHHTERFRRLIRSLMFWREYERLKDQTERFRSLSIDALSNAALYLLLQSSEGLAAHEANNLRRIMTFLLSVTPEEAKKHAWQFEDLYSALREAKERRNEDLFNALGKPEPPPKWRDLKDEDRRKFFSEAMTWKKDDEWYHRGLWVKPTCLEKWQQEWQRGLPKRQSAD
jgi:hypothetical protein